MLEKPGLADERIIACLRDKYGIPMAAVEFLPLGNDSSAWVYRVSADNGPDYFLKVRNGSPDTRSLAVPRFLKARGIEAVVAPLVTLTGQLSQALDDFILLLYPFVEGRAGMDIGLSDSQWVDYGAFLQSLHSTNLPADLADGLPRETFIPQPKWSGAIRTLQARIARDDGTDPHERELAAFWRERTDEIGRLVARAEELGRGLQDKPLEFVLCHADIHTANLLLDQGGGMHVVDWDGPLWAPKERDLMFVAGATVGGFVIDAREEALFFRGYGPTAIDPTALAYYRYEWVVQDMGDYAERVFLMDDIGAETKQAAVEGFMEMFQPGNVVDAAYASEENLPLEFRTISQ